MSNKFLTACWLLLMPATPKVVLTALADHADDKGRCWPSIARLAKYTCRKERSIQRAIKWLLRHGAIRVDWGAGPHGCNVYTLTPSEYHAEGTSSPVAVAPLQETRPARNAPSTKVQANPANRTPDSRTQYAQTISNRKGTPNSDDGFDEFWREYPKKYGRPEAHVAWSALSPPDRASVMVGLGRWKSSPDWLKNDGQYVPKPVKWLLDRRWEDKRPVAEAAPKLLQPACAGAGCSSSGWIWVAGKQYCSSCYARLSEVMRGEELKQKLAAKGQAPPATFAGKAPH